ncbi:alpha/beta fold hydrolase [Pseudanabaena yagii]|uniref:alpha/beta fold hydrolase n=1 Tax=Pseudanabaena yagii TaxID=2661615 RepID=UPI001B7CF28C|nr:alpha/beta hydrolase [Pseudanabaena yagii]
MIGFLGYKDALKFQSIIPNHKLVWIKNSGHVPHLECPEIAAQEMMGFASSDRLS